MLSTPHASLYAPGRFVHRYPPQRVHFGADGAQQLAGLLEQRGVRRGLLVCGRHLGATPLPETVVAGAGGRIAGVWTGVRAHPPAATIDAGVEQMRALDADALISLGGGSAHDTMRAMALCAATGTRILDQFAPGRAYVRHGELAGIVPLVAIPSTLSSAESTFGGGVVAGGRKYVFVGESLYIGDIVLDPRVFASTPMPTLLATGLNALHHAVGRLFAAGRQPIADAQFLQTLRILPPALRRLHASGAVDDAALASAILGAHLSESTNVLGGIGHAIAHVLGGRLGIPHGIAHGIAMPRAMRFDARRNPSPAPAAIDATGVVPVSGEAAEEALERFLLDLMQALDLPTRLRDVGVKPEDVPLIAADVLVDFSAAAAGDRASQADVRAIVERAW